MAGYFVLSSPISELSSSAPVLCFEKFVLIDDVEFCMLSELHYIQSYLL